MYNTRVLFTSFNPCTPCGVQQYIRIIRCFNPCAPKERNKFWCAGLFLIAAVKTHPRAVKDAVCSRLPYLYSMPELPKCPDFLTVKSRLCRLRGSTPEPVDCLLLVGDATAFPSGHCRRNEGDFFWYLRGRGILVISAEIILHYVNFMIN